MGPFGHLTELKLGLKYCIHFFKHLIFKIETALNDFNVLFIGWYCLLAGYIKNLLVNLNHNYVEGDLGPRKNIII